jgi:hypothetical protein
MNAIPLIQRVVAILWPSFITAGIATVLFTTMLDPALIFIDYDISRLGSYTISFFLFWSFGAITAASTCYFLKPCEAINKARERAKAEAMEIARAIAQENSMAAKK